VTATGNTPEPAAGGTMADGLRQRHAAVFGRAQLDELHALGLDVVEAARGGATVAGADGGEYLDCIGGGGIFNLGRRPAEVAEGLREAVRLTDQGNFPLISAEKADYAERLAAFVPGDLGCSMFSVSRGEALDFACKLARACTGRPGLVAVDGGWHGATGFALSLSERPGKERFGPLIPAVTVVPFNDAAAAGRALHEGVAAFVLEPVQAENGCRVVERSYLEEIARLCRERGILLVLDETQTGMGRTGTRFAYGRWGIVPDILVLGESLAAGMFPICATLFREDLQGFLNDHPLIHLSTFGGSDVGCVVGQRALDVYEREEPWKNAAAAGERLAHALTALADAEPASVKGVAGLGLLLAVRLEDEEAARLFCRALAAEGVLAMPGMVARDTVVLRPSLLVTDAEVDRIAAACAAAAEAVAAARTRAAARAVEEPIPTAAAATAEPSPAEQPVAKPRRKRASKAGGAGTAPAKATSKKPAKRGAADESPAKARATKPKPRTRRKPSTES
jgi:putrescine aminotransferase